MLPPTADSTAPTHMRQGSITIMDLVFVTFLLLVLVGLEPFKFSSLAELQQAGSGQGDTARQLAYVAVFASILGVSLHARGPRALKVLPTSMLVLIIWCVMSILWSVAPEVSARRIGLTVIIILSVSLCCNILGAERALQILRLVLTALLFANFISLLIVPQAVHLASEANGTLTGNWRGLHSHKNQAGAISCMSALLFFHRYKTTGRWRHLLLATAAAVFVLGTASKTAIAVFVLASLMGWAYASFQKSSGGRKLFRVAVYGLISVLILGSVIFYEDIVELVGDPRALTGRGAIWQLSIRSIFERPLLGVGFGAFSQSGPNSPLVALGRDTWLSTVLHSHNGYLEVTATIGTIGLLLTTIALVIVPLRRLLFSQGPHHAFSWAVLVAFLAMNVTESLLLTRDMPQWVIFLVALCILPPSATASAPKRAQ
jgi:O-antigen ligase